MIKTTGGIAIVCLLLAGCTTGVIDLEIPIDDTSWSLWANSEEALVDSQHTDYGTYPNPRRLKWMKVMLNPDGQLCAYDGEQHWCGGPIQGIPYRTVVNVQADRYCARVVDIYGNNVREGCKEGPPPETFSSVVPDLPGPDNVDNATQDAVMVGATLVVNAINDSLAKIGLKSRVSLPENAGLLDFEDGDISVSDGTCKDVMDYLDSEFSDDHPGTDDYVFGPEAIAECLQEGRCRIGQLVTRAMAQACDSVPEGVELFLAEDGIISGAGGGVAQLCDENNGEIDRCVGSPLVLDLAGDGLQLQGAAVSFPLFASQSMKVGWLAGSDDALLAVDLDGDGKISSGRELFGEVTGGWAPNGFAALARLDENNDGVISADDAAFERLVAWRDDGDGRSEKGELLPLADLGISRIPLSARRSEQVDAFGNQLGLIGRAYGKGEKEIPLIDVWFRMEASSSR